MTFDHKVARRFEGRSQAWRLGAASTAAVAVVLTAWALSIDFPRASGGFAGDAATYYTLGHSLADDFDFQYQRDDLVRVWKEFPSGPEGIFLKRGSKLGRLPSRLQVGPDRDMFRFDRAYLSPDLGKLAGNKAFESFTVFQVQAFLGQYRAQPISDLTLKSLVTFKPRLQCRKVTGQNCFALLERG